MIESTPPAGTPIIAPDAPTPLSIPPIDTQGIHTLTMTTQ